jgi:membrane-associated protease RseP (regulator of RpoE activity)
MVEVNTRLIFLLGTLGLIGFLMWWDRKNVERVSILFFRRTKNGIDMIDRIAKKAPRFWKVYGWLGVVAGIISMVLITGLMGSMVFEVVSTGEPSGEAGVALPSTGDSVTAQPGIISIPAEAWLISIAILMVVHELSHGIIARSENFEINSVGVLVLGIIPGAFVEPKGENMLPGGEEVEGESHGAWDQGNWTSRIKVLCAGSWANYLTAGLFILIAGGMTGAVSFSTGIMYQAQEDYPAGQAGMTNGTLYSLGQNEVREIEDIEAATEDLSPGDSIVLNTSEGEFNVTATSREDFEGGYIGVRFTGIDQQYKNGFQSYSGFLGWIIGVFQIVAFLNLGIGLFNMLPAKPLDGGHVLDALVERFAGEEYRYFVNAWSASLLLTIMAVIVYSLIAS